MDGKKKSLNGTIFTNLRNCVGQDEMERTLVVVTCYRDLYQLHIMFRSIKRYLKPSNIIIIVNEEYDKRWHPWYDSTKLLLSNHTVKVFFRRDFIDSNLKKHNLVFDGWWLHGILKIAVSNVVNTDEYILLDSKNFFIRQTKLEDIKRRRATEVFNDIGWDIGWISAVTSKLSAPLINLLSWDHKLLLDSSETPYIINTSYAQQLINHFGGLHCFVKWYLTVCYNLFACRLATPPEDERRAFVTECYLYELFCSLELGVKHIGEVEKNSWVLWNKKYAQIPKEPINQIPESIHVGGIHRDYINESTKLEIDSIYNYFGLDED